jgi:hypothetical protein
MGSLTRCDVDARYPDVAESCSAPESVHGDWRATLTVVDGAGLDDVLSGRNIFLLISDAATIMSLPRLGSVESIRAVLTGTSEEFRDFYDNERLVTGVLVQKVQDNIIGPNSEKLREADKRYRLHDLLSAMLLHAPNSLGQRYVAVCLHIAHQKGEDGLVDAAKVWLDNLFLPSPSYFFLLHLLTSDA